jgi:hypothetical protein
MGDLPDYTRQVTIRYEGGFIGLEELAVRLGFPGVWDLRGNIVLMEDFESELTEWTDLSSGGTSSAIRSSRHKFSGDWSVKLYTDNIASAGAQLWRYFQHPGLVKYGLFARFAWDWDCQLIGLHADFTETDKAYDCYVEYDYGAGTLTVIRGDGGSGVVATDLYLAADRYIWIPILVTFDLATGYYDKLYFADREYDISTFPLDTSTGGIYPYASITVYTERNASGSFTVYVDDIIIAKSVP